MPCRQPEPAPCVEQRPLEPEDRAIFVEAFKRLSPDSRYLRFGAPKPRLSEREVTYLLSVDHHDHEAMLALDCATGMPVAVARYVRYADRPDTAEVAVTVLDDWQGRGIGERLLASLEPRARAEAVRRLRAEILLDNRRAQRLVTRLGYRLVGREGNLAAYELDLAVPAATLETLKEAA